jgi:hypothetical protein
VCVSVCVSHLHERNPLVPQPMAPNTCVSRVVSIAAAGAAEDSAAYSGADRGTVEGSGAALALACGLRATNVTGATSLLLLLGREALAEEGRALELHAGLGVTVFGLALVLRAESGRRAAAAVEVEEEAVAEVMVVAAGGALRAEEGRGVVADGASLTSDDGRARADAGRCLREAVEAVVEATEATETKLHRAASRPPAVPLLLRAELGRVVVAVVAAFAAFFLNTSSERCLRLSVARSALASSACPPP